MHGYCSVKVTYLLPQSARSCQASMLAEKWNMNYDRCLFWLRCQVCLFLLKSVIICMFVRGHRFTICHPVVANVDLAFSEGRLIDKIL